MQDISSVGVAVTPTYFWVRIFDYDPERDGREKGTLLEEYYLDNAATREQAKTLVQTRYGAAPLKWAKPQKGPGVYVLVMESTRFFYDRFYTTIDTLCFWCHAPIVGPAREFPRHTPAGTDFGPDTVYFCTYDCKRQFHFATDPRYEGDFQEKEAGDQGETFGYIYHLYNRADNCHYVGQTRFLPFFRWQEHVKSGLKGDIEDLVFSVLTRVRRKSGATDQDNRQYLTDLESWWINKFVEEGHQVVNLTQPPITEAALREQYNTLIARKAQLSLEL